mmetsp:Transcript_57567/g.162361  ORF Transcript_57567/g.162361 Transcript_57567/m.162361 type:complete len:371 (-) Transcript_57567:20-1132(-)
MGSGAPPPLRRASSYSGLKDGKMMHAARVRPPAEPRSAGPGRSAWTTGPGAHLCGVAETPVALHDLHHLGRPALGGLPAAGARDPLRLPAEHLLQGLGDELLLVRREEGPVDGHVGRALDAVGLEVELLPHLGGEVLPALLVVLVRAPQVDVVAGYQRLRLPVHHDDLLEAGPVHHFEADACGRLDGLLGPLGRRVEVAHLCPVPQGREVRLHVLPAAAHHDRLRVCLRPSHVVLRVLLRRDDDELAAALLVHARLEGLRERDGGVHAYPAPLRQLEDYHALHVDAGPDLARLVLLLGLLEPRLQVRALAAPLHEGARLLVGPLVVVVRLPDALSPRDRLEHPELLPGHRPPRPAGWRAPGARVWAGPAR